MDIEELKKSGTIEDVEVWADQAKRIYFKDGAQIYVDEIAQILKDHEERLYNRNDIAYDQKKWPKIRDEMSSQLRSLIQVITQEPKPK